MRYYASTSAAFLVTAAVVEDNGARAGITARGGPPEW